jgi:hypothetical protein
MLKLTDERFPRVSLTFPSGEGTARMVAAHIPHTGTQPVRCPQPPQLLVVRAKRCVAGLLSTFFARSD